jgi:hypothetical protein
MAVRKRAQTEKLARVDCGECGKPAGLVDGRTIYPHRPDLHAKAFWKCVCGAYVGCHDGTFNPKGSPSGHETRQARIAAHAAFDPLWRRKAEQAGIAKGHARAKAYRWLSERLGIDAKETHIGMFDAATARRVVEVCAPFNRSASA